MVYSEFVLKSSPQQMDDDEILASMLEINNNGQSNDYDWGMRLKNRDNNPNHFYWTVIDEVTGRSLMKVKYT